MEAFRSAAAPSNLAQQRRAFDALIASADAESGGGDHAALTLLQAAIASASARLGGWLTRAEVAAMLDSEDARACRVIPFAR